MMLQYNLRLSAPPLSGTSFIWNLIYLVSRARLDSFLFLGGGRGGGGKKESGQTALDVLFVLCHKNRGGHAQKQRWNF